MRDDRERLLDVQEAIDRIEEHTASDRALFDQDRLVQTWVIHHLQIIGEAVRSLSEEIKSAHAEVNWSKIIGMRNILVHHYFGIDKDVVWAVVESDLPKLKQSVEHMLHELGEQ